MRRSGLGRCSGIVCGYCVSEECIAQAGEMYNNDIAQKEAIRCEDVRDAAASMHCSQR